MSHQKLLTACLGLLTMAALTVPNTLALGLDDAGPVDDALDGAGLAGATAAACHDTSTGGKSGRISFNGYGTFPLRAQAGDGCGSERCDDWISGEVFSNGAWRHMSLVEDGVWGEGCFVWCHYDGYSLHIYDLHQGHVSFTDPPNGPPVVSFNCGTSVDPGTWVFRGTLDLVSDCDAGHGEPACSASLA